MMMVSPLLARVMSERVLLRSFRDATIAMQQSVAHVLHKTVPGWGITGRRPLGVDRWAQVLWREGRLRAADGDVGNHERQTSSAHRQPINVVANRHDVLQHALQR